MLEALRERAIFAHQLWEWDARAANSAFMKKNLYDSLIVFPLSYTVSKSDIKKIYQALEHFLLSYDQNLSQK